MPPAISANMTPSVFRPWTPPRIRATIPTAASATHTRSSRLREPTIATASGPMNSIVTPTPSGILLIAS